MNTKKVKMISKGLNDISLSISDMSANPSNGWCRQFLKIETKLTPITFSCVLSLFCTLNIFEETVATYEQKNKY